MSILAFWGSVILVAFLLAKVEINIEGKNGYAAKLPVSWRTNSKWIKAFLGGTSYHLYMWSLLLALIHLPFVVGLTWSLGAELLILSFLMLVTVLEDFLWFVLNPHYGIRKYRRKYIPWFQDRWLWLAPTWYFYYLPIGILLYLTSFYVG